MYSKEPRLHRILIVSNNHTKIHIRGLKSFGYAKSPGLVSYATIVYGLPIELPLTLLTFFQFVLTIYGNVQWKTFSSKLNFEDRFAPLLTISG